MAVDQIALDKAADRFLDIGFQADGWTGALEAFSVAAGAQGTVVLPAADITPGPLPMTPSLVESSQVYLRDRWFERDARYSITWAMFRHGVMTDFNLGVEPKLINPLYYEEFLRPMRLGWFAGLGLKIGSVPWCASIQKAYGDEPFSHRDLSSLVAIAPRISMSLSLLEQLDNARVRGIADALETIATPAFLLNRFGKVIRFNAAADRLLGDDVTVRNGILAVWGPDGHALQSRIAAVLHTAELASPLSGRPLTLRRSAGRRPFIAQVQRLRSEPALAYLSAAWGIITITSQNDPAPLDADDLRALFGLTDKQASIVAALAKAYGETNEVLRQENISYDTLKTHLRNIHAKMDTRSIAELLSRLSAIAAALRRPD